MTDPERGVGLAPVESRRDTEWCRDLLGRAGLPTADLDDRVVSTSADGRLTLFLVEADEERVGCIGIERYGDAALLRSAAIADGSRGQGYGTDAVRSLEARAENAGFGTLYLLTTTAAAFFAGLGYEQVEREAVPPSVRCSTEFGELCPSSATVMRRRL